MSEKSNVAFFKQRLHSLIEQIEVYERVLSSENSQALAILGQLKGQIALLSKEADVEFARPDQNVEHSLSPRELEVLLLIYEGHPNKEIAYQLSISSKTVQFHIKSIFTKLKVGSRTEAVVTALKMGIIA